MLQFLLVLVVLAAVVYLLIGPLRQVGGPRPGRRAEEAAADVQELEAEREAKYREIRDAELDRQVGKLSDTEWRSQDRALRAEAVEILRRLDRATERAAGARDADAGA
jgi:hypothetical protein